MSVMNESILKISTIFFEKLWVNFSELKVIRELENIYRIALKSDDSTLLIGPHWKNLDTISHLLRLIISRQNTINVQIHIEVNDYLEKKDAKLISFIQNKIEQIEISGKEIILPFFSSYERKKVHSYVSWKSGNMYTYSQWEWKDRRIHLCKREEKLTIDMDGNTI